MTEHAITRARPAGATGLRAILGIDALTCVAMGLLLLAFADLLAGPLGLPARLLLVAGLVLLPCAALMYAAARGTGPGRALAWLVVLGNLGWVLASVAVVFMLAPTPLGVAFLLAQAAVVVVLGGLEYRGLRGQAG